MQDSICKLKMQNEKPSAVNCNGKPLNKKLWQLVQTWVECQKWQTFKSKTLGWPLLQTMMKQDSNGSNFLKKIFFEFISLYFSFLRLKKLALYSFQKCKKHQQSKFFTTESCLAVLAVSYWVIWWMDKNIICVTLCFKCKQFPDEKCERQSIVVRNVVCRYFNDFNCQHRNPILLRPNKTEIDGRNSVLAPIDL